MEENRKVNEARHRKKTKQKTKRFSSSPSISTPNRGKGRKKRWHLLLVGNIKGLNMICRFKNIYAPNNDRERQELWKELQVRLNNCEVSWSLGGISMLLGV
ncbi:Uncharacterized protein TCM_040648 [Theobroma cacao]|uniref:Uncharacterized protein n=1 Tax=Theobroma cacao TaxID=3641 RepID=A0A061GTA1_THECC|nr:Uncharacterized protein TCM_040648 [Theobroma cacao]